MLGPFLHDYNDEFRYMAGSFIIGVVLSGINFLPLIFCYLLDKRLSNIEDGTFAHL